MIKVIKPGIQMSIQDQGRHGYRHLGISQSGCIDPIAQIVCNRLVGNPDNTPVIEITLGMGEIYFDQDYYIALHGADMHATLAGNRILPGWNYYVKKGQTLKFATCRKGLRGYLAIAGQWQIDTILGSASTDIAAGFGGLHGTELQADDTINITPHYNSKLNLGAMLPAQTTEIRFHTGPHEQILPADTINEFLNNSWQVTANSNRMGVRLESDDCNLSHDLSLPSMAVMPGTIQLPPSGEPIVLLNDAQTTGGYPVLGTVIATDLRLFAQLKAGDFINFKHVDFNSAEKANAQQQAHLNQLAIALSYQHK